MSTVCLVSVLLLWAIVLFLGFLLLGALRAVGLVRWRLDQLEATMPSRIGRSGLPVGKKAPDFTLPKIADGEVSLQDYAGHSVLLVFLQPGCGPCQRITPELNRLHDTGEVEVLVVQNGNVEAVCEWVREHHPRFPVVVQDRYALSKKYEVFATPFAFLINQRGVIASRGLASTKQYLGYILTRAGCEAGEQDAVDPANETHKNAMVDSLASVPVSNSKETDHV